MATDAGSPCARCHVAGGPAAPLSRTRITKDEEWLLSHMADPVALAPGVRPAQEPAPRPMMSRFKAQAVVSYLRRERAGRAHPVIAGPERLVASTYAEMGVACHRIFGDGGTMGPDLTRVGARRDAAAIKAVIEDAPQVYGETAMPPFKNRLKPEQIAALANYLAARK